jgi:dipeptidyl aminopeptidase/acylaminoacyl peptidase
LASDTGAFFAPSSDSGTGYLLFQRNNALLAQRFDPDRLQLQGEPEVLVDQIASIFLPSFSVSNTGTLIYTGTNPKKVQPTWFDRDGRVISKQGVPDVYFGLQPSPNGTLIATTLFDPQTSGSNLWLLEPTGVRNRITFDSRTFTQSPVWSPDGSQVMFTAITPGGGLDLYRKAANGANESTLLYKSSEYKWPNSISSDGRYVLYTTGGVAQSKTDLWLLTMDEKTKSSPFLNTPFDEKDGQFSPDSHWVAYESNESASSEIYVRPFPDPSKNRWLVSKGGGTNPRWRGDGKEIFYLAPDQSLMAVEVSSGASFHPGVPKMLFRVEGADGFSVSADGKKFMVGVPSGDSLAVPFTVMVNWQASLRK